MKFIDGHCDSILKCYNEGISFFDKNPNLHLNYEKMAQSNIVIQFFALFIESKYKPHQALEQALKLILFFKKHILSNNAIKLLTSKNELLLLETNKLAILSIEGGEPLGESLEVLEILYNLGVRSVGLTWNQRNSIANGCLDTNIGLSKFGRNLVNKMQELGMIVDCSHMSERGLVEVLEIATSPIIISHANCKKLCNHPRNISNDNLRQIAKNGGVIGITFVPEFLTDKNASVSDVVKHIYHASMIAGVDHIAIGSDFDGFDNLPAGIDGAQSLPVLVDALKDQGFSLTEINKILYENYLRVLKNTLSD